MSTKHTPEPWRTSSKVNQENIYSPTYGCISIAFHNNTHADEHKANAKRIVDCVNALANVENPAEFLYDLRGENSRLRQAVLNAEKQLSSIKSGHSQHTLKAMVELQEVLKSIK